MARRTQSRRSAPPTPRLGHGEFVAYPGGPAGIYDLLEPVAAVAGDPRHLGARGISLDRPGRTARGSGELPAGVGALVAPPPEGFTVVVQQTEFRPGELRTEAERLRREHAGVLAAASAR